jgi:hypothetical protein
LAAHDLRIEVRPPPRESRNSDPPQIAADVAAVKAAFPAGRATWLRAKGAPSRTGTSLPSLADPRRTPAENGIRNIEIA